MNRTKPGLSLCNISFIQDGRTLLHNLNAEFPGNACTVLLGPSGAGKTTCLRLIAGLEQPVTGEIRFQDFILSNESIFVPPRERDVGFCFQENALWPALTVRKHLELPLRSIQNKQVYVDNMADRLLSSFGLQEVADRFPEQLSGGETKRLELARSVAIDPAILLLDEPLANIDGPARDELIRYLGEVKKQERTVVYVTHQLEEACALGDYLVILSQGEILQQGEIRETILHPADSTVARLLGYTNFFPVSIENGMAVSSFGKWAVKKEHRPSAIAAAFSTDLEAVPDPKGKAVVESCHPEKRIFKLRIRLEDKTYHAISSQGIETGQRVALRVTHPPALVSENE